MRGGDLDNDSRNGALQRRGRHFANVCRTQRDGKGTGREAGLLPGVLRARARESGRGRGRGGGRERQSALEARRDADACRHANTPRALWTVTASRC